MPFVIYNTTTKHRYRIRTGSVWELERTAKAVKTKNKLSDEWIVAEYSVWAADDHDVEVISVMSGKPVTIKASDRGDPATDPSMEGYWSM